MFAESSCGSGSIAFSIFSGQILINQPTLEPIMYRDDSDAGAGFFFGMDDKELELFDLPTDIEGQQEFIAKNFCCILYLGII